MFLHVQVKKPRHESMTRVDDDSNMPRSQDDSSVSRQTIFLGGVAYVVYFGGNVDGGDE